MPSVNEVLSWLHIGDLHLTRETEQNHWDLKRIVGLAKGLPAGTIDFAVLPGDNADDGTPEQFSLVRDAVAPVPGVAALWEAPVPAGGRCVLVRAHDATGRADEDRVEPGGPGWTAPKRHADGRDGDRVGPWPEKGILGTQLEPNRNGRKW